MVSKALIIVRGLSLASPTGETLLENATFSLTNQSRAALVGSNGSGKSTLLRALMGQAGDQVVAGTVEYGNKGGLIEHVPQYPPADVLDSSVEEMVLRHMRSRLGADVEEWRGHVALDEMGFRGNMLDRKVRELSGGEVNLALLARSLAVKPSLLLLDEPTNHLDTEGIYRFEQGLAKVDLPFLLVSHDRELLDRFTKQTLFLAYKTISRVDLPYSEAKEDLQKQREGLEKVRRLQERRRDQIARRVAWLQNWAKISDNMAQVYRAQCTKLERFERNMVDVPKEKQKKLTLDAAEIRTHTAIQIRNLEVLIPGTTRKLFSIEALSISPGERVAIMGANGAGKSTFLDQMVNIYRTAGSAGPGESGIRINPQVRMGYYDQKQQGMNPEESIIDFIARAGDLSPAVAHKALVTAGFPYDRHDHRVREFSGGERARLQFLAICHSRVNVGVLDEPTNHLDVSGIEQLEEELQDFGGAIIFVSHDRRFLENVGTTFYLIRDGYLRLVAGPEAYYQYLDEDSRREVIPEPPSPKRAKAPIGRSASDATSPESPDDLYRRWFELEEAREKLVSDSEEYRRISAEISALEDRLK